MSKTLYLVVMLGIICTITLVSVPSLFTKACPKCGTRNFIGVDKCKKCGEAFPEE